MTEKPRTGATPNGVNQQHTARLTDSQKELVYHLQDHLHREGAYADALNPLAMAYAAGKGIGVKEAKLEINDQFQKELGADLYGYLQNFRANRGMSSDGPERSGRS